MAETIAGCDRPDRFTADQIAACLVRVHTDIDARLNRTYHAALSAISPADRPALREAQRAWIAFRLKDRASLNGGWRGHRSVRVRIDAARADLLAIDARERQLRVYLADGAGR